MTTTDNENPSLQRVPLQPAVDPLSLRDELQSGHQQEDSHDERHIHQDVPPDNRPEPEWLCLNQEDRQREERRRSEQSKRAEQESAEHVSEALNGGLQAATHACTLP